MKREREGSMDAEYEDPQTPGAEAAPGLAEGMRRLAADGIELLRLRIELFGTEWEAEKLRIFAALTGLLLAILLGGATLVMLSAAILLLCPPEWRWALALSLAIVFGLLARRVWRQAMAQLRPPGGAFALTLAELKRDKDQFGGS
jgi:uncharacterized membrane protein YqjE